MTNYIIRRRGVGEKIGQMEDYSTTGLKVIRSDRELSSAADYVFRWGTTSNLPGDPVVVNRASAIHTVYDKRMFRKRMADNGCAPRTWIYFGPFLEWIDSGPFLDEFSPDMVHIVRPEHHIRSLDLNVCPTISSVYTACQKYDRYYISEYIRKDQEYRVFVVSGRVIAMIRKVPVDRDAVSWGCVTEGQFEYIPWTEWPLDAIRKALQAFSLSGLDFGAIDLISAPAGRYGENRGYWVLEINTAPELTPYYMKTFVKAFDYIVQNGKDQIPAVEGHGFNGFIHPAICLTAKVSS